MSMSIDLPLDFVWGINDVGAPVVELVNRHNQNKPLGSFTLDQNTLTDSLEADVDEKYKNPNIDIDEWMDLVSFLRRQADVLEEIYRESFS